MRSLGQTVSHQPWWMLGLFLFAEKEAEEEAKEVGYLCIAKWVKT